MSGPFRSFMTKVKPIKLKEPLAETLGAFQEESPAVDYTYIETIKMAGHSCPTVTGAYLVCQKALDALYPNEIPTRGEIGVTVYGEADDGTYGVMGQVFSFLTGAAPLSGFRGLGPKFGRKDLLKFVPKKIDAQAMSFEFKRLDTGKAALVKFYPQYIPYPPEKSMRMGGLMEKVLWDAAKKDEIKEFQDLWIGKVEQMLLEQKDIDKWINVTVKEG